jgi:hypothetical protein
MRISRLRRGPGSFPEQGHISCPYASFEFIGRPGI